MANSQLFCKHPERARGPVIRRESLYPHEFTHVVPTRNSISSNTRMVAGFRRTRAAFLGTVLFRFASGHRRCCGRRLIAVGLPLRTGLDWGPASCLGEQRFALIGGVETLGSGRLPFVPVMKAADLRIATKIG